MLLRPKQRNEKATWSPLVAEPVFSCSLDREHVWATLRYVDLNPVRAGLAVDAVAYAWSSP